MSQYFNEIIEKYVSEVASTLPMLPVDAIARVVNILKEAQLSGKRVFIFGNGGSAATASHFASDLCKGTINQTMPRIKAFALNDNVPLLSAWSNDTVYENCFAEQVISFVEKGDIVIGISGSGNSQNILHGIKMAADRGATTIGFTGFNGGKIKNMVDASVVVPNHSMLQIEDIHLLLCHVVTHCLRFKGEIPSESNPVSQAMILAAGEGTRLHPFTMETPKALLSVNGRPALDYSLGWLKSHGITGVTINLHHLGYKLEQSLGDGSQFRIKITYSREEKLLGTAGGVKKAGHFFTGTFVVLYGDILTDFDLEEMILFHRKKQSIATLALTAEADPKDAGIVIMASDGRISSFIEKPDSISDRKGYRNGGVYVIEKDVLDYIPADGFSDFGYDVFPRLLKMNLPVYGYVLKPDDYLIDIGSIATYKQAEIDISTGKMKMGFRDSLYAKAAI